MITKYAGNEKQQANRLQILFRNISVAHPERPGMEPGLNIAYLHTGVKALLQVRKN